MENTNIMTIQEYKNKLNELHEQIKNNPFRRGYETNYKYGKGYYTTVYEFAWTFYHLIKDIKNNKLADINEFDKRLAKIDVMDFIHDFYGACNVSKAAIICYSKNIIEEFEALKIIYQYEELLELDISCIHKYLETGLFNQYPFRHKNKIVWSEWDNDHENFITDFNGKDDIEKEL